MVKLITPISELFGNNEVASRIMAASDGLECREDAIKAQFPKQHLFHFDVNIIHPWDETRRERLAAAVNSKPDLNLITILCPSG
jgi:hypothetical protein